MVKVAFDPSFSRAYKRRIAGNPPRTAKFAEKTKIFSANPFETSLKTHALTGTLKGYWSFTVEYDLRVIFCFEGKETAVLIDIGTHDQVYR